jgi:hypothetical protein
MDEVDVLMMVLIESREGLYKLESGSYKSQGQ